MKKLTAYLLKAKKLSFCTSIQVLKLSEIADALDIPIGTCKSRLNYALNQLRKRFPEHKSVSFQKWKAKSMKSINSAVEEVLHSNVNKSRTSISFEQVWEQVYKTKIRRESSLQQKK